MLRIDLKPGESVRIGDNCVITLEEKAGKAARIAFQADRSVPIERVKPAQDKERPFAGITPAAA